MKYKRKRGLNALSFSYASGTILINFLLFFYTKYAQKAKKDML